jgi:hypothetical protein
MYMESRIQRTTLPLLLICPECGHRFPWSGRDFEDWIACGFCGHQDEAWFFWHSLYPPAIIDEGLVKYEVFSIGAHYTNDAPLLPTEKFVEQLVGRYSGPVHGGGPYMWILRGWYQQPDNPNNGSIEYKVYASGHLSAKNELADGILVADRTVLNSEFEAIARRLTVGVLSVRSLPKPAGIHP